MDWRVLVVDDLQAADVIEVIEGNKVVEPPDSLICLPCTNFSEATKRLREEKFDLVILDLKNDAANEQDVLAGETVFSELKECRFLPVIFHTGYPQKVSDLTSPYVKVVTRGGDWKALRATIKEVLDTKLPKLIRHIEEEQRKLAEQLYQFTNEKVFFSEKFFFLFFFKTKTNRTQKLLKNHSKN